jgi:cyanophycin synthetase
MLEEMKILNDEANPNEARTFNGYTYSVAVPTTTSPFIPLTHLSPPLALLAEPRIYAGYLKGFRQPFGLIKLRLQSVNTRQILQEAIHYYFAKFPLTNLLQSQEDVVACFGTAVCALQTAGGLPVFESSQLERLSPQQQEFKLWVPLLFGGCFHQVISFLLKFFNHHLTESEFVKDENITNHITALINTLKSHAPQGTNSLHFLKAAATENIPWAHVALNAFQYGYGSSSRWLDSTFTDKTSKVSAILAGNKSTIAFLLHRSGFPVTEQYVISHETEALERAKAVGYPVVIKPIDQHGGKGVFANLVSEQALKRAFHEAKKHSQTILLEKHIPGKDYRCIVLNGKLIWSIERIPAGVTGDGENSIEVLMQQHNQRHAAIYPLRHIQLSADTLDYLQEQGLTLKDIISKNQFVPLNRIANISAGGTPVGVFDKVHQDNKRLIEAAARLLRMDIVGVDFISPDISEPYYQNGGTIIEINAQPQLGSTTAPHIYKEILSELLPQQGRIPIIVVCKKDFSDDSFVRSLQNSYPDKKVGTAKNNTVMINGQKIMATPSLFAAGQQLLLMNDIDILIYCVSHHQDIEQHGLPFDSYDNLFLFDFPLENQGDSDVAETLLKACQSQPTMMN